MATEALVENKSDVEAPVPEEEVKEMEDTEEKDEVEEENSELEEEEPEKENVDPEAEAEEENDDDDNDIAVEVKEEAEEGDPRKKKAKRGRKVSSKKEVEVTPGKNPVTPTSERPARERKSVDRYSSPADPKPTPSKVLSIQKGRGTQLKDIPNVAFKLSKRKADGNLQVLHTILFGKKAKAHSLKRNIGQFSGFVWAENEEKQKGKVREKLDKCVKEKLVDFCGVLNVQINKTAVKKEEISAKLLEFLESPHATTDILLADKEQKAKKRKKAASGKHVSPGEPSKDTPAKRQKTSEGGKKRKQSSKSEDVNDDQVESPEAKDDSHESSDNEANLKEESDHLMGKSDEEDEEEDEPKEQMSNHKSSSKKIQKETSGAKSNDKPELVKKGTPDKPVKKGTPDKPVKSPTKSTKKSSSSTSKKDDAHPDATSGSLSKSKGSASKKQKVEKESPKSQSKDKSTGKKQSSKSPSENSVNVQGKGKSNKKSKPEPSREEMLAVVVGILKEVDFNTATLSDILRQLGTHFGVDLMHRKAEVKDIITEVINNMSDEEEDGDDAEDNDEKDGDEDGDDTEDHDEKDGDGDDDA